MGSFSWNSGVVCGADFPNLFDGFTQNPQNSEFWAGTGGRGGSSLSSSLVLDSERGELVKAPARLLGQKVISEAKSIAALKSHSEAERRRRERINTHLATLRTLIPCTDKMDKASLLAEAINQVRELQRNATEASRGFVIPMDIDEVTVEPHEYGYDGGPFFIRASLCCEYQPELLSDLRQTLEALNLKTMRAEISTLGDRVKNVFVMTDCKTESVDNAEVRRLLMSSVHKALSSVLDRVTASAEFSPRTTLSNKRRRISLFDYSSSSS